MMRSLLAKLWWTLALGVGAAACRGPTTSLDTDATTHGTTAATQDTTAETTSTHDDDDGTSDEGPVSCPSACTPILSRTWEHEGPSGTYAVVEMLRDPEGSLWLGTQRSAGAVGLLRLSAQGEPELAINPGLPCESCELVDIALHPSGDVLIGATARPALEPPQAVIARIDVTTSEVAWVRALALSASDATLPRLGELAVLGSDRIMALRVNGSPEGEEIETLDFTADGTLRTQGYVTAQPGSGAGWPPLAVAVPTGELVLAHMGWDDETERAVPFTTRAIPGLRILSRVPLVQVLDDLAVDDAGRRLELARSRGTETITLSLTSRRSSDAERWSASLPLLSTSSTRAALAIGPDQAVYVAARTTPKAEPGQTYEVLLEVARWSADGAPGWHAARPLDMMATSDPLELLVDDDHGVIVGTVVQGRLYVARYEQACACE